MAQALFQMCFLLGFFYKHEAFVIVLKREQAVVQRNLLLKPPFAVRYLTIKGQYQQSWLGVALFYYCSKEIKVVLSF